MASLAKRRTENAPGGIFVDTTCIDCGTCMWMAPDVFAEEGRQSAVHRQPTDDAGRARAHQALVACPTGSIGSDDAAGVAQAARSFPHPVAPGIYHCGYHAESSFGAASWLVEGPKGNVLVDSPRFAGPLVKRLEQMGGVDWMLFSHRDDVADHARFARHFGLQRVIHEGDAAAVPEAEIVLEGEGGEVAGLEWMHVPGHTLGHAVYRHERTVFTGDHLAWNAGKQRLVAFRRACWYDWGKQTESMKRLRSWDFDRVLPGHGDPVELPPDQAAGHMERLVAWMEQA